MSGTVATKTIIKRRVGWGDGTFAVGQSVEILDRMTTPDGWEVTGRQERPYFANVQFFGDTDPHDHRTSAPATRPPSTEDLKREWAPIDQAIDDALGTPRWHEIATEGLPADEGDYFTWDDTSVEQLALVSADGRAYWTNPFGVDSAMEYEVRNAARITHWQPVVKPAPPTKEPR